MVVIVVIIVPHSSIPYLPKVRLGTEGIPVVEVKVLCLAKYVP